MILSKEDEFSALQLVTGTAISANVVDLTAGGIGAPLLSDIGTGAAVYLWISVGGVVTAVGAATVTFTLESDSTADLATSATVHWTSAVIAKATLVAGFNVITLRVPNEKKYERFLGVRYTVATGPLTVVSSFNAWLTLGPQSGRSTNYAGGFVVL